MLLRVRIVGIWDMEHFFCGHDVRLLLGASKKIWEIIWVGSIDPSGVQN